MTHHANNVWPIALAHRALCSAPSELRISCALVRGLAEMALRETANVYVIMGTGVPRAPPRALGGQKVPVMDTAFALELVCASATILPRLDITLE